MRKGLTELAVALAVALLAAGVWGQNVVSYLNGVPYTFPSSQGSADQILVESDGTGALAWQNPSSSEGLWSDCVVLSTVSCPSGWTRVSAADDLFLRAATSYASTGGSDTHTHTLSGITAGTAPALSGSTGSSGVTISGSTATASASHSHGYTYSSTSGNTPGTPPAGAAASSLTIGTTDPSHSHGAGTYAGGSHTHSAGSLSVSSHSHAVGTLALATASNVAARYDLLVCLKD